MGHVFSWEDSISNLCFLINLKSHSNRYLNFIIYLIDKNKGRYIIKFSTIDSDFNLRFNLKFYILSPTDWKCFSIKWHPFVQTNTP